MLNFQAPKICGGSGGIHGAKYDKYS